MIGERLAIANLLAAAIAAAVRIATPYEHGIWLVAYLFLVGFAAQLLLSVGQRALSPAPPAPHVVRRQAVLWNLGVIAVPAGVLGDVRLAIVLGGAALLAALADHARTAFAANRGGTGGRAAHAGYSALVLAMGASVFAGIALGWDRPWI